MLLRHFFAQTFHSHSLYSLHVLPLTPCTFLTLTPFSYTFIARLASPSHITPPHRIVALKLVVPAPHQRCSVKRSQTRRPCIARPTLRLRLPPSSFPPSNRMLCTGRCCRSVLVLFRRVTAHPHHFSHQASV